MDCLPSLSLQYKFAARVIGCAACPVARAESLNGTATLASLRFGAQASATCFVATRLAAGSTRGTLQPSACMTGRHVCRLPCAHASHY